MNSNFKLLSAGLLVAMLALAGCGGGSDTPAGPTDEEIAAMEAAEAAAAAITAAHMAARALDASSDDAAVTNVETLIAAAKTAISALPAADQADKLAELADAEKLAAAQRRVLIVQAERDAAQKAADDAETAEEERLAEEEKKRMETELANARAMAAKLYAGIGTAPLLATGDGARSAAYSGTNDATITVTMDDAAVGDGNDVTQVLKATMMMVATNHGWEGKQYTASGTGVDGTYEAIVYSNVGAPTQGKKFGNAEPGTTYQYTLANGMLTIDASTTAAHAAKVGGAAFDHTAGVKQFPLPSPNPSGATKVSVTGTFHGVSGTYTCTPTDDTVACAASRTATGYTLGLRTIADSSFAASDTAWTFRPSNPEARVTDSPDTAYASYGWWLHKDSDGKWTASAFVDDKGTAPAPVSGVTALQGTATYTGGAAGKYALANPLGGTNDAGHFTARATLEADFGDEDALGTITGTIDQFMGADGESRDWMVKLNESALSNAGVISGALEAGSTTTIDSANSGPQKTVWTIDGTAAAASGQWSGSLKDAAATATDVSGVPKIATGTFHTEYGAAGRMVGAFGANK